MKRLVIMTLAALGLAACSTSPIEQHQEYVMEERERTIEQVDETIDNIPEWYFDTPKGDADSAYGIGMGYSTTLNNAITKARTRAAANVIENHSSEVAKLTKDYTASTSSNGTKGERSIEDTQSTIESFSVGELENISVIDKAILREGEGYRVYMLLYGSKVDFDKHAILQQVREQSTLAHAELTERVNAHKQSLVTTE